MKLFEYNNLIENINYLVFKCCGEVLYFRLHIMIIRVTKAFFVCLKSFHRFEHNYYNYSLLAELITCTLFVKDEMNLSYIYYTEEFRNFFTTKGSMK